VIELGRFAIGTVADVHICCGIAFEDEQVRADAVEEPAVVTDGECSARIIWRGNDREEILS
jgi:hypothetical protein